MLFIYRGRQQRQSILTPSTASSSLQRCVITSILTLTKCRRRSYGIFSLSSRSCLANNASVTVSSGDPLDKVPTWKTLNVFQLSICSKQTMSMCVETSKATAAFSVRQAICTCILAKSTVEEMRLSVTCETSSTRGAVPASRLQVRWLVVCRHRTCPNCSWTAMNTSRTSRNLHLCRQSHIRKNDRITLRLLPTTPPLSACSRRLTFQGLQWLGRSSHHMKQSNPPTGASS